MVAEMTWRSLAVEALSIQAERIQELVPGVMEDRDPNDLKGLRVAYRRARQALKLFAPVLGRHRSDALRERLKETRTTLGPLRQLDLAVPAIGAFLDQGAALQDVRLPIEAKLAIRRAFFRHEMLAQPLDPRVQVDLDDLRDPGRWAARMKGERPIARDVEALVWEAAKPLHRLREAAVEGFEDEAWHPIRLKVKALCDTLDCLASHLAPAILERRNDLKSLQGRLGQLEDTSNRITLVRQLVEDRQLPKQARRAMKEFLRVERQQRRDLRHDLEIVWGEHREFWSGFRPT